MRDMGISAKKAQQHVDFVRSQFKHPVQELWFWNRAELWKDLEAESNTLMASHKSAHAARVASLPAATNAPAHSVSALQGMALGKGSRVVIGGLVSSPEMNGRIGVICGDLSPQNGRFTVKISADGARPGVLGTFSPANLSVHKHNPSMEWLDEDGLVCPKNVNFSRECAKGHALLSFCTDGLNRSANMLMCRVCHIVAKSDLGAWLVCSIAGCCGGYAVCGSCASASNMASPVFAPPAHDEVCMQVFRHSTARAQGCSQWRALILLAAQGVGIPYLKWLRSTLQPSIVGITTSQFCQMHVRPRTFRSRSSVADELAACAATAHHVGNATWFISHVWSSVFVDTLDAVLLFFEGRDDAATAKVWFDIFSQSQHAGLPGQASKPPSWCAHVMFSWFLFITVSTCTWAYSKAA